MVLSLSSLWWLHGFLSSLLLSCSMYMVSSLVHSSAWFNVTCSVLCLVPPPLSYVVICILYPVACAWFPVPDIYGESSVMNSHARCSSIIKTVRTVEKIVLVKFHFFVRSSYLKPMPAEYHLSAEGKCTVI
jgi:hypothetical protein